jgi:hypothetical protein
MKKTKFNLALVVVLVSFVVTACKSTEDEDTDDDADTPEAEACFESTDVLVSNGGTDTILAYSADGTFKRIIFQLSTVSGEAIYGLDYMAATGEVIVAIDGTDRVMAIDPTDCSARNLVANVNLTGTLRGVTQLSGGDILVVETNNVERFTSDGVRVTSGGWPLSLQTAGTDIHALSAGGFVHCSTTTDVVRTYSDAGVQAATRSSGIASTTDAVGCKELSNGSIAVAWSGTTDSVVIYSSNLATAQYTYSNTSVLSTPGSLAEKANGNILIADRTLNYLVEITATGTYVGQFAAGLLNTPEYVLVIP